MRNKIKKSLYLFLILINISFIFASCKGIQFSNSKISTATEFTKGQAMILVAEEKNKYEKRFGSNIWTLLSGDNTQYFKDYVVDNVKLYIEKLMTLKLLAKEKNITLSENDISRSEIAGKKYFASLSQDDLDFISCSQEDAIELYKDIKLVNMVIDNLVQNSNIELSISESKVISVEYIKLESKEEADTVREQVGVKNANFSFFAKRYNKDGDITMIIKRGDAMSTYFPEVFYLSKGEISDVLSYQNDYYIFKCTNDYMEKETKQRKIEILSNIKNKEFNEQFDSFYEENKVLSNASYWDSIDLAAAPHCTVEQFYKIYDECFGESNA